MRVAFKTRARTATWVLTALSTGVVLTGCGGSDTKSTPAAPPPPEVGVVSATPGRADLMTELPGRLEAFRVAQVRARAAGILQKRLFTEGSDVKAGQPLFEIDAAPYRATLASAQAQLARAEANLLQPDSPAPGYFLGLSLVRQGRMMEARGVWREALEGMAVVPAGDSAADGARAFMADRVERLDSMLQQMGALPPEQGSGAAGEPAAQE